MYARLAYTGVIIIWATTPLAIKWSSEGTGYLFAVTSRMVLGVMCAWLMLHVLKQALPLHARAIAVYLLGGVNIYLSMTCIYWASQHIPSGWISVLFGLSPIVTGVLAIAILGENALSLHKLLGMVLGLVGLTIVFGRGYASGHVFVAGVVAVLLGVLSHSLSAIMIKRLQARVSGVAVATGGLTVAAPLFLVTWLLLEGRMPETISARAVYAIVYLGIFASTVGFAMYFYLLTHMDVNRVALITLITPVCALTLGNVLNDEPIGPEVLTGTGFIVTGLLFYEYGRRLIHYVFRLD